ncbi:MAG: cohesin domain-containing protein, partial [Bacteroidota bacterium]
MKHFTTTLLLLLIIGSAAFGQYTVTLPTVTASPNENVAIPLNVTGFTSIGSIQLFIKVDHKVLTLLSITGFSQTGLVYGSGVTGDTIRIIWTNVTPHTWANGTLLTMNFKYNGLSSTMNFIPSQCEVAKFVGGIPTVLTGTFNNGAISPYQGNAEQAHIGNVFAVTGNAVAVPLWYSSTSTNPSAANITQKIAYDATKLTFVNVTGTGVLSTGITSSAASGIITLTWANASGALINTPGSHFNLNFTYTGSTTTSVTFSTG